MARKTVRKASRKPVRAKAVKKRVVRKRTASDPRSKPLVRAALAISLDGYIADPKGGVDWLNPYFSPELDFHGFMAQIGATIMGRKTYEAALKLGMPPRSETQPVVVLSHRLPSKARHGIEWFAGDMADLVDRLRRKLAGSGKDIWHMGGGSAIDSFLAAGLIDRLELGIIPVVLGDGIPLFPRHARGLTELELTRSRSLGNGILEAWYEPKSRH